MPSPAPDLRCNFRRELTLAAATATVVDVPVANANDWSIVLKNTGNTNPLTGVTVAVSPLGEDFEAPASITVDLPLAAGASLPAIRGEREPVATVRLTLTSTLGTTVRVEAAGR